MNQGLVGRLVALRAVYETLAISAPTVFDAARGVMTRERADRRLARWSRKLLEQAGVDLVVQGKENFTEGQSYVVMSNHQSHYDVPVLFQAFLPSPLRMVAKAELFKFPVFGPALRHAGFIEVDRKNRAQAIASLGRARDTLADGVSVWIAPEGTRSRTGELQSFKKGGFVLAMETGLPILPVGVVGSRDILRPGSGNVHLGARVKVAFGKPIVPTSHDPRDVAARDGLMQTVHTTIAELVQSVSR